MINILQLVNGFAIGGGEIKLLELVERLDRSKYNQVIASVGQGGPLQAKFEALGQPVYVFPKRHRFDYSLVRNVRKLLQEHEINILQTTLFYADVIGAFAANGKIPVISWEVVTQPYRQVHKTAYSIAKKNFARVITVSNAIREKIIAERKLNPDKVETIHYGVDTQKYARNEAARIRLRQELAIQDNEIVLGTVARLTDQKGHTYLVAAAPVIVKAFPNVKFVFAGDGYLRDSLQAKIGALGLESHFLFLGFRNDVPDLLSAFDVFVLPSLYEGLPNVVLEAMACSNPVIATAVDGTVEAVVEGETGYLVPSKNPQALQQAILKILNDRNQLCAMARNGRKRVVEYFAVEKQIRAFEDLYTKVFTENLRK